MYIQRTIDHYLTDWKNDNHRKPLLIRGARQVGKSSAVRHLGQSFSSYIEVNFEKQPELKTIFDQLHDVHEITGRIGVVLGKDIVQGETLLFLDEIQSCPAAIKSLWFFKEDFPELHVVAAGSLLEFAMKDLSSFGVGRIRSLFIYPFSFDEFLVADGKTSWLQEKRKADGKHPLFDALHHELVQCYRSYLIVGGMPASVCAWVETHDYRKCQVEQDDIQLSFFDDFAKYASKVDTTLLRNTLLSVVTQIGHKFMYAKVAGGYRPEEVKKALQMLCDAGLLIQVSHTAASGIPLGAQINDKFRKYNYLDSGLLLRIMNLSLGGAQQLTEQILAGAAADLVNKGSLTEMVLGWELVKYDNPQLKHELYYWENTNNGAASEVDYLMTRDMHILPVECKSGISGKMKSLWQFMQHKQLQNGIRCSLENFAYLYSTDKESERSLRVAIIPLYAISNLFSSN